MGKEIIVNANMAEEVRIAIKENRKLLDLDFENQSRTKHKGNIYKGIITNIEDSLEAAFIEIGEERQAFLARSEIRPSFIKSDIKDPARRRFLIFLNEGKKLLFK